MSKCDHFFSLTSQIAKIKNSRANPPPNSSTINGGLSREGSIKGTTVEPNRSCPKPSERSDSLSSCLFERGTVIKINFVVQA